MMVRSDDVAPYAIDPSLPTALPRDGRPAIVTVGTFDGVHRGHWEVLQEICRRATETGGRSILVTFHPHPLRVVRPEHAPPLLTTLSEKREVLAESGLEYVVFLPFTRTLQRYPARRFVEEILVGRIGMKELVIGYDHGFGRDREGGVETLRQIGRELGFAVDVVDAFHAESEPVSSSRIRRLLEAGDAAAAARLLGRPYALEGIVVRGEQKGRELGFPTANVEVGNPEKALPKEGVYAAYGWVGGQRVPGLLHLGPRPTFPGFAPTIELHLLDWSGDLYGHHLRVEVVDRIRDIRPFASVKALIEAIRGDERDGRRMLGLTGG
ncbi:bifunctional riboflavin kinase/FAD synthetase [Longimicrobium sp.]|uniref:bifunctional riboflavin kinase/FAD synthetase n=1 Tax=Longimicrobium sp. TaxID=2029185 RepID=UPI002E377C4C|nr:bifunctional riboflavin kinase/FAD synthetase [Longimicrobium sp.]HEX6042695.1 bifunctional riboflavin kinase/FAD synthetase [Longimicrobium sp.]